MGQRQGRLWLGVRYDLPLPRRLREGRALRLAPSCPFGYGAVLSNSAQQRPPNGRSTAGQKAKRQKKAQDAGLAQSGLWAHHAAQAIPTPTGPCVHRCTGMAPASHPRHRRRHAAHNRLGCTTPAPQTQGGLGLAKTGTPINGAFHPLPRPPTRLHRDVPCGMAEMDKDFFSHRFNSSSEYGMSSQATAWVKM